jgi:hypothetical protein
VEFSIPKMTSSPKTLAKDENFSRTSDAIFKAFLKRGIIHFCGVNAEIVALRLSLKFIFIY